jgi:MFS family permease
MEIMRRRPFWAILGSHASDCICHSVLLVHLVPFAIESGMPRVQAATLMSALGAGALVGRLAGGIMSDRIGPKGTLLLFLSMQTFPVPLLLFSPGLGTMYFVAIFVGIGLGGHGTLYPLVTREFYGPKRVGLLYGTFTMGASIGMASGSFFGGVLYDLAGNYSWAFLYSFTLGVISLLLVWTYPNRTYLVEPSPKAAQPGLA